MLETFRLGHALLVGVGADLPSTVDDAVGLADILRDPARCAYPPDQVHLLTGEHATREHVLTALDVLARSADPQSTVIVYFSGHGYQVASPTGEFYYLMPYGYDLNRLYRTAISGAEFAQRLRAIPAQKLLVLLDCCHAGGVGDAKAPGLELTRSPLPPEAQALLAEGGGQVLIASSREDELSFAGKPYSAFTLALVEALCGTGVAKQDGYVHVADLALHARQVVPGRTGDRQHPILHFEHADNFVLAYYAGGDAEPKGPPFTGAPAIEPSPGAWTIDQRGQTVHGPQTIITGGKQGVVLSGTTTFQGLAVIGGGEAVDLRGAQDVVYKPAGPVDVIKTVIAGDVVASTVITAQEVRYTPPPEIPSPPEPARPPQVPSFVGRQAELAYFAAKLETTHLAVITGMAGVGKTALAAELVRQVFTPDLVFWHSFHEGDGAEVIIEKLAIFLARHGQDELWRMLRSTQQVGGQPPAAAVLFDYLFQMVRGQGYLLCLDDFQFVDDDPLLTQLAERLRDVVLAGEISLLITSRRMPAFVQTVEFEALSGLSAADTHRLLAARGVTLPDEQVEALYTQTEGNAEVLVLAIEAIKQASDPARLITHLVEADDVECYLMTQVDAGLTAEERRVMEGVAVLLGYPGTRDAVEAVLDSGSRRRTLSDLCRRYLLTASEGEWGREYGQHAMVQAFYYDLPSQQDRQAMHRRAGAHYEAKEPDVLKAARHFYWAKEYERAAQLATADIWAIVNQGQTRALCLLLKQLTAEQLDPLLWTAVTIAHGEVCTLLREEETARQCYQEALTQLATMPDSPAVRELRGRACWGMGDALEYDSPQKALDWLYRGLKELGGASERQEAALHIKIGSIQRTLEDFTVALDALQQGLELLPEGLDQWRAIAWLNVGNVYHFQGKAEQAKERYHRALEISQQLGDYWRMVDIWMNLAVEADIAGDWAGAVDEYCKALDLARQLGSVRQQAMLELNLGVVNMNQGDDDPAEKHLSTCIALASEHNLNEILIAAQSSLADLHLRRGDPRAAEPLLAAAERLATEKGVTYRLPEIHRGWAQAQLDLHQPQAALDHAERSVSLARELKSTPEEGMSLRVWGQASRDSGQRQPAAEAFERSLTLLTDYDPYEAARTRVQWGLALVSDGHGDQGVRLLQEARATFVELGAQRDLATVEQILSTCS